MMAVLLTITRCFGLVLICLSLTNCREQQKWSPTKKPKISAPPTYRENAYQIGEHWDRRLLENPQIFPAQVFQLYRYGMGVVGTGVYIGEFNNKHLVLTAAHVYPDLYDCADEVEFIAHIDNSNFFYSCAGWFHKFKEVDLMVFEVTSKDPSIIDLLIPSKFSNIPQKKDQKLNFVSTERLPPYFTFDWFIDDSSDCRLLSSQSKYIDDPDKVGPVHSSSWSLPVGCDGKHGDSGAPVFDENFNLAGILWTGKYPKDSRSNSLTPTSEKELWTNYNYMVPISNLKDYLKLSRYERLTAETKKTLREIWESIPDL